MKLLEYRRKRKFFRTPEPAPELRFVVQKHAASRLHYDFRLELDGVLKSWAVPKGPSLNPLDQRLAVMVEDHPLEYGDFEGNIPKGNYGAGKVEIWDQGTYRERNSEGRAASEAAIRAGLLKGKITFLLEGKKLRGEFALVQLKGRDPRHWLLLKKRDSQSSFRYSIDTSVARTKKSAMPGPIKPAVAVPADYLPEGKGWIYEPEGTGRRVMARVVRGKATLPGASREILEKLSRLGNVVIDGELVESAGKTRFEAFDLLYENGEDLRSIPLLQRKRRLRGLGIFASLVRYRPHRLYPPRQGVFIAKEAAGAYRSGKASGWVRVKIDAKKSSRVSGGEEFRLSHPDKVFFPDEGYTKADLAAYYESVAPYLVPHLADRPLSLHRQPDGIRDPGFYHKDMSGFLPRRLRTERVYSASSGRTIQYLVGQDAWTLRYLVNLGCIELHPWLSRVGSLERPDFVVIDLDPDGNRFEDVIQVAKEVHRVLERIGAPSFCKTSGASGLHICIPTGARHSYDESRRFAEAVCREVHAKFPKLTSVERNPAKRRGKIYLDFLQNRRGQTLAAPYCVRPFPGAPVSMPVEWKELTPRLKPGDFTIKNALARLRRKGDLWEKITQSAVDIMKCLSKLSDEKGRWQSHPRNPKLRPSPRPRPNRVGSSKRAKRAKPSRKSATR